MVTGSQVHFFPPDRNIGKKPIYQTSKRQVIEGHFFLTYVFLMAEKKAVKRNELRMLGNGEVVTLKRKGNIFFSDIDEKGKKKCERRVKVEV